MKIVKYPHPALRVQAKPVLPIDKEIQLAAGHMLELMYASEGLGLAAPQIALEHRLLVMNFAGDPEQKEVEVVAINPVIIDSKGAISDREGCLSFPGLYQSVRRFKTVTVQAYNLKGQALEITATDLPSRLWQHEVDHLLGVLFIDKMGPIARLSSRSYIRSFEKDFRRAREKGEIPSDEVLLQQLQELEKLA